MSRIFTFLVASSMLAVSARAELVTYPAGPGVETINDFQVRVRQAEGQWYPVATYPVKVDRVHSARHNAETASMAYFDFDGNVEVEVISDRKSVV